jgi:nucleoside-diphosphate-sugar epimerase
MRVVLTGGSGFVGRVLVERLASAGHEVIILTRTSASIGPGLALVWDMSHHARPPAMQGPIDAVAHLAQARNYRRFPEDAPEMFRVNVAATAALVDWAVSGGATRFVLVSSGTVYEPFTGPLEEDAPLAPQGYLGASKLAAEVIARPYASKMALCVLRVFFPYGPGQTDRLIPNLIRRIRAGQAVTVAGGHGLVFTPTYVDDVADVIAAALLEGWTGTLNVATPHAMSIRAVSDRIGELLGSAPCFERVDRVAAKIVPDLRRLAARYDIKSFTAFDQGLRWTIEAAEHKVCEA